MNAREITRPEERIQLVRHEEERETSPKERIEELVSFIKEHTITKAGLCQAHPREPLPADYVHPNQSNPTELSQADYMDDEKTQFLSSRIDGILNQGTEKTKSAFSSGSIYRVPENLRKLNPSAYTPQLITIGPLYWGRGPYDFVKRYYANNLLLRLTEGEKSDEKAEVLLECVREMEMCVEGAKKSNKEKAVEMMVVDGCFILELLYRYYDLMKKYQNSRESGNSKAGSSNQQPHVGDDTSRQKQLMIDPIFDIISTENIIKEDLLLLENQIPFFVLEKLFKLTVERIPNCPYKCSLIDYVLFYFRNTLNPECNYTDDCVVQVSGEGERPAGKTKHYFHILHLLHENFLPPEPSQTQEPSQRTIQKTKFNEFTLSASNLEYAGVQFKPLLGKNLFDVKFEEDKGLSWWCRRASFAIPTIGIHDPTESFLRNLIAFEQCCPGVSQHFTSYAFLMDMLINSEKDVQVLKDAKVIYNYLGADEDASNLFNNLCKGVILDKFYFNDPCSRAFNYSQYGWPKILAYLKTTYFSSPWAFIGFCLAFIAFGMSVAQFVYGFL